MVLAAESADGVVFRPAKLSRPAPKDWPSKTAFWPPNAVFGPIWGLSFVYDDAASGCEPGQRLKALLKKGASVSVSADGLNWTSNFAKWSSEQVDPSFSVFRNPVNSSELVVTARPQELRASGRHAGLFV